MIEKAIQIALSAHMGQRDKSGSPYILHPLRMMTKLMNENEQIVAVLHDVIEDTEVSMGDLLEAGFSKDIIEALDALTHRVGESYDDYISRILKNSLAAVVKLIDLEDNLSRTIPDQVEQQRLRLKYEKAKMRLIQGR